MTYLIGLYKGGGTFCLVPIINKAQSFSHHTMSSKPIVTVFGATGTHTYYGNWELTP